MLKLEVLINYVRLCRESMSFVATAGGSQRQRALVKNFHGKLLCRAWKGNEKSSNDNKIMVEKVFLPCVPEAVCTSYCHRKRNREKMQLNILIKEKRETFARSHPLPTPNVEHDKGKLTSNYTISLIIHNEVFDVSLQVDIFFVFSLSTSFV